MGNKIVYEDFAVGASTYAYVDLSASDHQMQTVSSGGETITVDPYHVDSIFSTQPNDYMAFDYNGHDSNYPARVFAEGVVESGEIVGGDEYGYVSDRISDYSKVFSSNPKLVIKFSDNKTFSGNGIGIYFSKYYCTKVKVRYQLADSSYTTAEQYEIDSLYAFLPKSVQNFKAVEIEFVETQNDNQYVIVKKVEFGRNVEITNFRSISFNKKIDFYCADVPINTLDATFIYDGELNFYNNQKVRLYHNDELFGTYWIAESEMQTDTIYSITAEDVFSTLDGSVAESKVAPSEYYAFLLKKFYAKYISEEINDTATLELPDEYDDETQMFGRLATSTKRRSLAEFLFAFGYSARAVADGSIQAFPLNKTVLLNIDQSRILDNSTYTGTKRVTHISVTYSDYQFAHEPKDEEKTILKGFEDVYPDTGETLVWNNPIMQASALGEDGEPIIASNEIGSDTIYRYEQDPIKQVFFSPETVKVYPEEHQTQRLDEEIAGYRVSVIKFEYDTPVSNGDTENSLTFNRAFIPYGYEENAFATICQKANQKTGEVRAKVILNYEAEEDDETVTKYLDVGDYVSIETKYSGTKKGTITEIDADVSEVDIVGNVVITVWE